MSNTQGALVGAAIGAMVGAVVLVAIVTVAPTNLYSATAVRSVSSAAAVPVNAPSMAQIRAVAGAQYQPTQRAAFQGQQDVIVQTQGAHVYSWAFVLFATVAGAVNGLFLYNRRVAMAATTGRREALMAGVAAAGLAASPAFAAYGDAANVFGTPKDTDQFINIKGEGWSGKIMSHFQVSKERDVPGMVARWEDNGDYVTTASVIVRTVGKNSVTELGNIDEVRNSIVTPLLGQQSFDGASISEGGFAPGRFSAAAVLSQSEETKDGKVYYTYELLTRTADGNEGGRHQLFSVSASNGKLVILKMQAGDKRWFMGVERPLKTSIATFRNTA